MQLVIRAESFDLRVARVEHFDQVTQGQRTDEHRRFVLVEFRLGGAIEMADLSFGHDR